MGSQIRAVDAADGRGAPGAKLGAGARSQFEVVDVAWDEALGAEALDQALLEHFAAAFKDKHGKDALSSPKALAKLRRQACAQQTWGWRPLLGFHG